MKCFLISMLTFLSTITFGQDKSDYIHFNKLTELSGTEFVIATAENWRKMGPNNSYLLFINTRTGETKQIDFPKGAFLNKVAQVKIDNLGINKVIVDAKTVNLDGNKSIDWGDPLQIIVVSTDGKEKTQITEDKYFASTWIVNNQTGIITITGHYDSNNNGKYDRSDKSEILLYDLKNMKLLNKLYPLAAI